MVFGLLIIPNFVCKVQITKWCRINFKVIILLSLHHQRMFYWPWLQNQQLAFLLRITKLQKKKKIVFNLSVIGQASLNKMAKFGELSSLKSKVIEHQTVNLITEAVEWPDCSVSPKIPSVFPAILFLPSLAILSQYEADKYLLTCFVLVTQEGGIFSCLSCSCDQDVLVWRLKQWQRSVDGH